MYYVIYQVDLKNETSHVFRAKTSGVSVVSSFSVERGHVIRMPVAGIVSGEMARKLARQMSGKLQKLKSLRCAGGA